MKKILGIMGSPRINGNTHILVSKILDGARAANAETEIIFLKDRNIKECIGCHVCWSGKDCVMKDDMCKLYPKIIQSDVIVFGTPVYWYAPTALMKGFIDRFVYFNCPENHAKIKGKKAVIAVPFEEENPETVKPVIDFFEKCFKYLELDFEYKIIAPGVTERGEIEKKTDILNQAFSIGQKLV